MQYISIFPTAGLIRGYRRALHLARKIPLFFCYASTLVIVLLAGLNLEKNGSAQNLEVLFLLMAGFLALTAFRAGLEEPQGKSLAARVWPVLIMVFPITGYLTSAGQNVKDERSWLMWGLYLIVFLALMIGVMFRQIAEPAGPIKRPNLFKIGMMGLYVLAGCMVIYFSEPISVWLGQLIGFITGT